MNEKGNRKLRYTALAVMIGAMMLTIYMLPIFPEVEFGDEPGEPIIEIRKWHTIFEGALGDLDQAYSTGNTSILAVWIVNHTVDGHVCYGNATAETGSHHSWSNDSTQFNSSVTVYGYAQASSFRLDVPHSTALDVIIRVRANTTNAATGSGATDQFNATWVSCNLTSADFSIPGGVNMTRFVTHNVTGDPFIYIDFVYNGTFQTNWDDSTTTAGAGIQISRGNESYFGWINLSCYY